MPELYARSRSEVRIGLRAHPSLPWLLLPPGTASQLVASSEVAPLPNVCAWCAGVLSLRGNLTPVFDLGGWLGQDSHGAGAGVLVIRPGAQALGLRCSETPQLIEATPVQATPPASLRAHLGQAFACAHGQAFEFDAHAWLRAVAREVPARVQ